MKLNRLFFLIAIITPTTFYAAQTTQSAAKAAPQTTQQLTQEKTTNINPVDLKSEAPQYMTDVQSYHTQRKQQSNWFFSHLPKTALPEALAAQITKTFEPLVQHLAPVFSGQTQPERAAEVMDHVLAFYGLLYMLAEEEQLSKQITTKKTGNKAELSEAPAETTVPSLKEPLTAQDLMRSKTWQDHMKIMIASSYHEEMILLGKVHKNEITLFNYLPQFEVAYYQETFQEIRQTSNITRYYLMLVNKMRKRFLQNIDRSNNDWGPLLNQLDQTEQSMKSASPAQKATLQKTLLEQRNKLFHQISEFQKSPFYLVTMQFEALDWSKKYPQEGISFPDPTNSENPNLTFEQVLKKGYRFDEYFTYESKTDTVTINPHVSLMLETAGKPGNRKLYYTALGEALFNQNITYKKLQQKGKDPIYIGIFNIESSQGPTNLSFSKFFGVETEAPKIIHKTKVPSKKTLVPTLGYLEVLSFTAMKLLYTDFSEIFEPGNLKAALEDMVVNPDLPNFITQRPEDYRILHEINNIKTFFKNHGALAAKTATTQGFLHSIVHCFESIAHKIEHIAESVWSDIKSAASEALKGVEEAGDAFVHGIEFVGEEAAASIMYASCVLATVTGIPCSQLQKAANAMQKAANTQLSVTTSDLLASVQDIATAAEDASKAVISIQCSVLTLISSKLGNDVSGVMNAVADGVINYYKDKMDMIIEVNSDIVQLSVDAVSAISNTIAAISTGNWGAAGAAWEKLGKDAAAAVLSTVTLAVKMFASALKSAMVAVAYLVSSLTDLVVDISAAVAMVAYDAFYGWETGNAKSFDHFQKAIGAHQRLISSIVTTALVIAVTVATGGAAAPFAVGMLGMQIGMMAMGAVGANQQDDAAIKKKAHEEAFVNDYKQYVIDNYNVIKSFNTNEAIETLAQLQTETMNQERALLYYQNFFNTSFNATLSSAAYGMGNYVKGLTQEDGTTGVMKADLGSLYGIETGRMNLSASGGFAVYNMGRGTFSQEAAVEPLMLLQNKASANGLKVEHNLTSFWFHQKDIANVPQKQKLKADILWRSIYEYDGPFYIGIYMTERFMDTKALNQVYAAFGQAITPQEGQTSTDSFEKAWENVDTMDRYLLDYDYLAKMFVFYRTKGGSKATTDPNAIPRLGVYVHEAPPTEPSASTTPALTPHTKGWLDLPFSLIEFKRGTWYRMQASLEGQNLEVAFWEVGDDAAAKAAQDTDTPPATATTAKAVVNQATIPTDVEALLVDKTPTGSIGFIASGASVEYIVKGATPTIKTSSQRQETNQQVAQQPGMQTTQAAEQKQWYQDLAKNMSPSFGSFKLQSFGQEAIMQSEYVYTTHTFSETVNDYVIFATTKNSPTIHQIGVNPSTNPAPEALVSLVSGTIYDEKGASVGYLNHPLTSYQKTHQSLSSSQQKGFKASKQAYLETIAGPFKFQNMTLSGNVSAMAQELFVYQNSTKTDYFMMAATNVDNNITTPNLPIMLNTNNNQISAAVSLVTNKVYTVGIQGNQPTTITNANMATISITEMSPALSYNLYSNYEKQLSVELQTTITSAQAAYKKEQAELLIDQQLEQAAQNASNNLATALSTAQTSLSLASGPTLTALQAAQTNGNAMATKLANEMKAFEAAMKTNKAGKETAVYQSLETTTTAATTMVNTLNTAATNAENAPPAPTTTGTSSSSTSSYSSSYSNYNTSTYGGYGSGSYTSSAYSSYGGYGGYGGGSDDY